jgi:hypothetical protein
MRAPRAVTGPITVPEPASQGDPLPVPRVAVARQSSDLVASQGGPNLAGSLAAEAHAQAARAARAPSAPLAQQQQRHPAARAGSGPLGQQRHPAARAPSGPLTQQRHPAARAPSGPLAQQRHPAARAPSGPLTGAVAKPRAPSGPIAVHLPPSAAGDAANENHLDTGLLELGDQFSSPNLDGPSLEIASLNPQPRRDQPQQPQPRREPTRRDSPHPAARGQAEGARENTAEQRAKRVRDLARYPVAPPKLMGAISYFLRVYARRRELESQVVKIAQQRKRLEFASDDALCLLGQALYIKRSDPQLKPLAAQLRVVGETAQDVGARAAAAKRTETELQQELAVLEREVLDAKTGAEPVQVREAELSQAVDAHKQQVKRREMLIVKAEAEMKALKAAVDPSSLAKIEALIAERDSHHGEIQALQISLMPIDEELLGVRATLDQHTAQIEGLHERMRKLQAQMGREHGRERVAAGGSQSAYRDALRSLANAATRLELAGLAPAEQKEALETNKVSVAHRESEELLRAAVGCYDGHAYQRGVQLLVGSIIGVFLLFAALIAF